jgi:hypothetical protein
MSYVPRGPGRPSHSRSGSGSGGVRDAKDRMALEQQRRQKTNKPQNMPPSRIPQPLSPSSQYSTNSPGPQRTQWAGRINAPNGRQVEGSQPPFAELSDNESGLTFLSQRNSVYQTPPGQLAQARAANGKPKTFSQESDTSLGSIPDFPVSLNSSTTNLQIPQPTGKRGYSSYYSHYSNNVAPIQEESIRGSVGSYASSNVIPTKISRVPDIFYEDADPSDEESESGSSRMSPVPVRTASIGRRAGRAAVTAIRGSKRRSRAHDSFKEVVHSPSEEALVEKEVVNPYELRPPGMARGLSPGPPRTSRQLSELLNDLERDAEILKRESKLGYNYPQKSGLSDRIGSKVPPHIDMSAVQDGQERGSLTSLPDLIRRATKLAANLDRGKTASRLGLEWMIAGEGDTVMNEKGYSDIKPDVWRSDLDDSMQTGTTLRDSMSRHDRTPRSRDRRGLDDIRGPRNMREQRHQREPEYRAPRRCCGLNKKCFIAILLLLTTLIVAAVVIPVMLIVVPKQHKANKPNDGDCSARLVCQNGGVSVSLPGGTCVCLCSDGYSGFICQNSPEPACTTINAPDDSKATIGTLIPPLIAAAQANFSIPLDEDLMLTRFAEFNLTCPVSNALVTFPSISLTTKRSTDPKPEPDAFLDISPQLKPRQIQTTDGVVVAPTSTTAAVAAATSVAVDPALQVGAGPANNTAINFARVSILFVLQDSASLDVTQAAQQNVYTYLLNASKNQSSVGQAMNVTLGSGYFMNIWDWTVTLKNGTVYGAGWNGTATSVASAGVTSIAAANGQ